jgi:hypothetical protein
MKMKAAFSSETLIPFCKSTWRYIQDNRNLVFTAKRASKHRNYCFTALVSTHKFVGNACSSVLRCLAYFMVISWTAALSLCGVTT